MKTSLRFFALAIISFASLATSPSIARADDWSHTVEFTSAQDASIRVVEPEGYTVTINGRTDTVPAVFAVDNANNYFVMAIASPEGATWSKKIEVKEFRQSVVRVKYTKAAAASPQGPRARAFVGTVKNTSDKCKAESQMTIKLEFMAGADVAKTAEVKPAGRTNLELVEGSYDVRRYQLDGTEWVFERTDTFNVKKDGWEYEWGCTARRPRR